MTYFYLGTKEKIVKDGKRFKKVSNSFLGQTKRKQTCQQVRHLEVSCETNIL